MFCPFRLQGVPSHILAVHTVRLLSEHQSVDIEAARGQV